MNAMVALMTPLVSCNTNASASDIRWPKGHVAPHFEYLDLKNMILTLMKLSASCDANTGANGAT